MEVSKAKEKVKELEASIFALILSFERETEVKVSSISLREDFTLEFDRKIIGVKLYTHID